MNATVIPAPTKWRHRVDAAGALRPFERAQMHFIGRAMVKKGVEKHAREHGIETVTIELMEELRKKRFGNDAPVFKF